MGQVTFGVWSSTWSAVWPLMSATQPQPPRASLWLKTEKQNPGTSNKKLTWGGEEGRGRKPGWLAQGKIRNKCQHLGFVSMWSKSFYYGKLAFALTAGRITLFLSPKEPLAFPHHSLPFACQGIWAARSHVRCQRLSFHLVQYVIFSVLSKFSWTERRLSKCHSNSKHIHSTSELARITGANSFRPP